MPDLNYVLDSQGELLELLRSLPDPRKRRGIRHRQANILAVAICATLSGMRSFVAIGEWAARLAARGTGAARLPLAPHPAAFPAVATQ